MGNRENPNQEDYIARLGAKSRKEHQEKIDALFSKYPNSIDWADDLAKSVIVTMFDSQDFLKGWEKYIKKDGLSEEEKRKDLAWSLMVSLSIELRHFRAEALSKVDGKVKYKYEKARKDLVEELNRAGHLSERIRESAGKLDERGMSSEANALRDAASILEEEFGGIGDKNG